MGSAATVLAGCIPDPVARGHAALAQAHSGLRELDEDLEALFSNWFDVGLLELQPITWDSPASLLEKLIRYEAVHEISSWTDLRNRLDSDRRCYAFFHPRIPREPLIFVEVAFVPRWPPTCRRCSMKPHRWKTCGASSGPSSIRSRTRRRACAA
jgi:hypothetical protein